ncbi:hypothetical protein ACJX0J_027581, partial [Zea mays]
FFFDQGWGFSLIKPHKKAICLIAAICNIIGVEQKLLNPGRIAVRRTSYHRFYYLSRYEHYLWWLRTKYSIHVDICFLLVLRYAYSVLILIHEGNCATFE